MRCETLALHHVLRTPPTPCQDASSFEERVERHPCICGIYLRRRRLTKVLGHVKYRDGVKRARVGAVTGWVTSLGSPKAYVATISPCQDASSFEERAERHPCHHAERHMWQPSHHAKMLPTPKNHSIKFLHFKKKKKTLNPKPPMWENPLASSHFTTEGRGYDIVNPKTRNIRLYVKCVFISDVFDGELFLRYLSFVKGIVDSNDLPLNVSHEILQESRIIQIMRKRLVQKAFNMILNFGKHLKLGCMEDHLNHKCIAPLLRFFSSHSEQELISLDEYVENMNPKQKDIYYIAADSLTSTKNTPFLEWLLEKEYEVLFLVDPIDKVAITKLKSYKEKNFVDITKEDLDLGDRNEEEKEKEIKLMKAQTIGDTSSLDFMRSRRVFRINPDHPIIKDLNVACLTSFDNPKALTVIDLLYDMALISSGFTPDNPSELSGKIYEMIAMALSVKWVAPPVEIVEPLVQIEGSTN
ncbi:unnamed protein product [Spirodela intermedia]|uniref:Uncharacterized protein n=1 Tax=Spirodela intermedia TaxID=51605 RepID=A0A7I8LES0_SPIIN|nr:unnamed protein product [Spirodela intermedia]